jgi:hypothetical protein
MALSALRGFAGHGPAVLFRGCAFAPLSPARGVLHLTYHSPKCSAFRHISAGGPPVIPISIPYVLETVGALDKLEGLRAAATAESMWFEMFDARSKIQTLLSGSVYTPYLRISRDKGDLLVGALAKILDRPGDWDKPVDPADAYWIGIRVEQFRLVFLSEMSTLPLFLVQKKENFDVPLLIDQGTGLFPASMTVKVPESAADAMQAGKALAFELGTACGFHVFRVMECVLRRYWDQVSGGKPLPKPPTIGKLAADMENKKFGDTKILESLKQLAKLHRNPCIHPDVILSVEEAIGTIGITRSIIGAMLAVLPDVPTTTASPVLAPSVSVSVPQKKQVKKKKASP